MAENDEKGSRLSAPHSGVGGGSDNGMEYLEFEQPIAELEYKLLELRRMSNGDDPSAKTSLDLDHDIASIKKKCEKLKESIYSNLSAWQISQLARHPSRPYTLDYVEALFSDFEELHGDRQFADDFAIITGIARFNGKPVAIIGHQKGRSTEEKVRRNFGMPKPEGYRKARRLLETAQRFRLPVLTFIDTPGAYPGIDAEERGQSEAIAVNLKIMSQLKTPIISTIIGEGGSGGALAIGVADCLLMLQYSTYSVISPEGCAAILWKDAGKAEAAATALGITSERLSHLGLVDEVIAEPLGGAQHDFPRLCSLLGKTLAARLERLQKMETDELLEVRYQKLVNVGQFQIN